MAKKKVCKSCRYFYEGSECPLCKSNTKANSWQGRLNILDPTNSDIGNKLGFKVKGEYAIKVR